MAHTKVTKTYSQNTGAANTFSYSGSFDVFKGTEVVALLDNVALTYTASTINESASPREYTVDTSAKTIHIGGADLSSGAIIIRPVTDMGSPTPRADYTPGASITSADLNNNQLQLMRKAMEYDEQKLSNTGGTMTGDLTMGEDTTLIFEGATDDAYETTLTVTDPTADRTITIPNVTGTVVTTGDTNTVTGTIIGNETITSANIAASTISATQLANGCVELAKLGADSVDATKIQDNAIDSEHYTDGSIDTAHIADLNVTTAKIAADAITGAKLADDACDSEHYTDGSIDAAHLAADCVTGAKIADDAIDSEHYTDGSIDAAHIASNAVTTAKINADAVTGAKIADDAIDSEHLVDGSIDTAHIADSQITSAKINDGTIVNADINGSAAIAHSKLANVTDGQILVGNGSNVPTAVAVSGDVTIANTGAVTIAANAVEIGMIGCEQTTLSDSDSHVPTSGAVVDYVAAQIAPIGGLEVIADDESFPNTLPAAGVVISITDAAGLQINSSGVSTNGDTLDNSTVTINGFPSSLRGGVGSNADPYVLGSGAGLMVQSTGSSQTYNYHKALLKESDFVQLSDDINDFNSKYRIASSAPGSDNDEGDLYFNTSTNKMYVYDGSAWGEVTSTGDYKLLGIKDNGQAYDGSLTFNGSNDQFDLFDGSSDASISNAGQLIVSLNGVIQKPNASYDAAGEGFALDGADGIRFCDPPASGSVCFVTQIGTATTVNVPADGSVTAAKIGSGAVTAAKIGTSAVETAKINADAVTGAKIADDQIDSEHYVDGSIDAAHIASNAVTTAKINADAVTGAKIADDAIDSEHYTDGSIDTAHIADNQITLAKMAGGTDGQIITYDASGDPVAVGPGTDGQVLTSTGAGSPPAFEDAGGGLTSDGNRNTVGGTNGGEDLAGGAYDNVLIGYDTGKEISTGDENTIIGSKAGDALGTAATGNVIIGYNALSAGTDSAEGVTVIGNNAMGETTTAVNGIVAIGTNCCKLMEGGGRVTAVGNNCLDANTSGDYNTAFGRAAGGSNTTGSYNVFVGNLAGFGNTDGSHNVFMGHNAGYQTSSGAEGNTVVGMHAGDALTSGDNNLLLGKYAGASSSPSGSLTTHDNACVLGDDSIGYLYCADTSISSSDSRDKADITNFTPGLSWIKALRPVTYKWDKRSWYLSDPSGDITSVTRDGSKKRSKVNIGFVAQEVLDVEKANGFGDSADTMLTVDLTEDGKRYGMKYERLVPVLVNAIKELEARIATLEAG